MSHTTKIGSTVFIGNSDLSGEIEIRTPEGKSLKVDGEALKLFVLQNMDEDFSINKPKSTQSFEEDCEISLNERTDNFEFLYKGELMHSCKSKFECEIAKRKLQHELGL